MSYQQEILTVTLSLNITDVNIIFRKAIIKGFFEDQLVNLDFKKSTIKHPTINGDGLNYGFIDIIDEYNGTKAANLSHYYLGICYRNTGEYEFAIDELKSFSSDDIMISTVAIGAIADCYMELNDFDKAINYYEKAVSNGDNKLTSPIYLFKAGLAYEDNQDFAGAEEKYKSIKADYPDSREAQTIDKYIARVESLK